MVHYLLPNRDVASDSSSAAMNPLNFGDQAMTSLLREMKTLGCAPSDLRVSILGGCVTSHEKPDTSMEIARRNVECAESLAARFGLPIAHRKVFAPDKMTIRFESATGVIYVSSSQSDIRPIKVHIVDDSSVTQQILRAKHRAFEKARHLDLLCIGASTGGAEALRELFRKFPSGTPPILIVQHMPAAFTKAFAASLNRSSRIETTEAQDGDILQANKAYIAPGGLQMKVVEDKSGRLKIALSDDPPVNRFKPSVDFLFNSVSKLDVSKRTSAALLTGMGDDGASGLLALRRAGAFTIAQDEASCVVFGMPKAAIERNAAVEVADLAEIADLLFQKSHKSGRHTA